LYGFFSVTWFFKWLQQVWVVWLALLSFWVVLALGTGLASRAVTPVKGALALYSLPNGLVSPHVGVIALALAAIVLGASVVTLQQQSWQNKTLKGKRTTEALEIACQHAEEQVQTLQGKVQSLELALQKAINRNKL
jgi:hypothetical protein